MQMLKVNEKYLVLRHFLMEEKELNRTNIGSWLHFLGQQQEMHKNP